MRPRITQGTGERDGETVFSIHNSASESARLGTETEPTRTGHVLALHLRYRTDAQRSCARFAPSLLAGSVLDRAFSRVRAGPRTLAPAVDLSLLDDLLVHDTRSGGTALRLRLETH